MSETALATPGLKKESSGITSSTLKIIAIVTMFLDHFAVVFGDELYKALPFLNAGGFEVLRVIGRLAFPIFAFMIAVGATYTSNIYKYLGRLLAFAFISEIPFDLGLYATPLKEVLHETEHQNVFFTLFLGLLSIFVYQKLKKYDLEFLAFLFLLFAAFAAENLLKTDYGAMGVLSIFMYYVFINAPNGVRQAGIVLTTVLISVMFTFSPYIETAVTYSGRTVHMYDLDISARVNMTELYAVFAAPLLLCHKGVKGRNMNRWIFYICYPAHILVLWLIHTLIFR